ncbi:FecR family protein [Mucilaginibacter xinganensis]|uniref:FecR family protein n=1 Tax=Mucilaginibacter xinganensis TaxID=1234841 RepID=A0A223NTK6_9SPHI|nr:FecR family protein [Mucilaginibacter xinganensis]ASU33100.1 FecR family protein [Mucilaginibacter xinganensis]
MDQQEFHRLIEKYLDGRASAEEEQLLLNYFNSFQSAGEWDETKLGNKQQLEDKMLARLQNSVRQSAEGSNNQVFSMFSFKRVAAAAIFLLAAGGMFYVVSKKTADKQLVVNKSQVKHDANPGGNRATLTLADGSTYVLDSAKNGVLAKKGNVSIKKEKDGQVTYAAETNEPANENVSALNTMSTKAGGQYQLLLADGTKVWLNSESSIKYPTAFKGRERTVELTGEAYFEVAKNAAMPFMVKVNNMQVRVLGTHFNIMAYDNENAIKTTLLEGAVKLTVGNHASVLKPGQQGRVTKSGDINIVDVDAEQAVAWKNGYFEFDRSSIREIMNQLARWYDIKVTYEGKIPDDEYVGKIERNVKLSQVLHILELSHVHFKLENKNLTVTP